MQDNLRNKVKLLKTFKGVSYKQIAILLQIKNNSFYNWLNGYYNLSTDKEIKLKNILNQFNIETR